MTEYAFLVQTCDLPENRVGATEDPGRVIAEQLLTLNKRLHASLASLDDGGWRVLSHHLLETNGSLIVSFLICRERRNEA